MSVVVEFEGVTSAKRGNGLYLEIAYKNLTGDYKGQVWKKGNFVANLDDDTKNLLKTLKVGEKIELDNEVVEKAGKKYYNLKTVRKATEKSSDTRHSDTKSNSYEPKKYDVDGAQIGNALNNAAIILGPKSTVEKLEETAWEVIEAGERLKAKLSAKRNGVEQTIVDTIGDQDFDFDEFDDLEN